MARPKKAIVDYFPHYVNHGKTMFTLETKYGNNGYAFWFKLLEILGSTEHHYINCNDADTWEYLLAKTKTDEGFAVEILGLLSKLNSIDGELWSQKIIRSQNFIDNLATVYSRREVDVYTKEDVMGLCIQKHPIKGVIVNINPQSIVTEVTEITKRKSPKENSETLNRMVDEFTKNEKLKQAFTDYFEMRNNIDKKKACTEKALKIIFKTMNGCSDETKIAMLEKSIMSNWAGVFVLSGTKAVQPSERHYRDAATYKEEEITDDTFKDRI